MSRILEKNNGWESKVNKIKTVAAISLAICIILSTTLGGMVLNWQALEQENVEDNRKILLKLINEIRLSYEYWENWTRWKKAEVNETEISLEDQRYFLDQHSEVYESILNEYNLDALKTIIIHGCIKTDSNISFPDVANTYKQLRNSFAPYEVMILPEYNGNLNWTETLQWISTDFTGDSLCLSAFEGGEDKLPDPNVKLGIEEIEEAMAISDVKMVRFAELISWYMGNAPQDLFSVINETRSILEFCKSKNLKVLWNEWKISYNVLPVLKSILSGYEDIVTFAYQTNNEFNEPFIGYLYATQFKHWGASVQSWYWEEQGFGLEGDMPLDLMVEHAVLARNMGAEIIQLEPYWYFFEDGEPLETIRTIWAVI